MTSATYTTRNKYGFKHKFASTTILALLITAFLVIVIAPLAAPALYPLYLSSLDIGPGSVGSAAGQDVPVARSLAEMREYGRFTLRPDMEAFTPWEETYGYVIIDDVPYYAIDLPSGEKVAAKVYQEHVTEGADGRQVLPVGTLRRVESQALRGNGVHMQLTTTQYYVDMEGDFAAMRSEEDFSWALGKRFIIFYFPILLLIRVIGVRRGTFAPAVLEKRDPLLPKNDLELWAASTCAIWASRGWPMEGWPLMGGMHRGFVRGYFAKTGLKNMWGVTTKEEGIAAVQELTEEHAGQPAGPWAAWDLCRATQLTGLLFHCRKIDRQEMDRLYSETCRVIQAMYSSWEQLAEHYLAGCSAWQHRSKNKEEADKDAAQRQRKYEQLKNTAYGPYAVPWDMDLRGNGGEAAEQSVCRQILKRYSLR
ncbi:MAG TPA: DUF1266 domain-containing protein [Candidatus Caccousia avistercoris]|nr:DUF1266 domain-containing protein [Candidatus Caccousia avistercoris]